MGDRKTFQDIRDNLISDYSNFIHNQDELYPDGINAYKVMIAIMNLQHDKEAYYGQSWRKYGHASAFLNTARKWDRIENMMKSYFSTGTDTLFGEGESVDVSTVDDEWLKQLLTRVSDDLDEDMKYSTSNETFLDTVLDMASYSLLWVGYIAAEHPELWEKFLKSNNIQFDGGNRNGKDSNGKNT